ncbi:MAG: hypothetical protein IJF47_03275 [Candidatus Methanomethylophilaceae archaeon]|nr:hypothetical protein [Candidatus Methanomethylophilaceae archaeon]
MFCVKCGKDCDDTINGLCIECFLNGRKLMKFPHHLDLQRCTNCEEYFINDRWQRMEESEAVEEMALTGMQVIPEAEVIAVGTMPEMQDERTFQVSIEADISVNGYITEDRDKTTIRIKNTVCKKCSRQLGNYYEATLQLRTGEKTFPDDLRDETVRRVRDNVEAQAKNNRGLFITKVQEVVGGIDIQLSNISLARSLAKNLTDAYGAEFKESSSLVGMSSDGIDIYRLTYLVRFPAYHLGDVMEIKGKPWKLVSLNKTGGKLVSLTDFRETSVRKAELQDMKVLVKSADVMEAIVLSSSGSEVQVMHPVNYSTLDLRVPPNTEVGETVQVVQVEEQLYYLP